MPAEQRTLTSWCAFKEEEEKVIGDEPANTRKLYLKVKEEPTLLYDKIYRDDILAHAYHLAKAN